MHLGRKARMKARWSADDDFIFSAAHGKPRAYSNVRRALASASQVAGLPTVRPHDLRHSYTSNLIAHADLVTVSRRRPQEPARHRDGLRARARHAAGAGRPVPRRQLPPRDSRRSLRAV